MAAATVLAAGAFGFATIFGVVAAPVAGVGLGLSASLLLLARRGLRPDASPVLAANVLAALLYVGVVVTPLLSGGLERAAAFGLCAVILTPAVLSRWTWVVVWSGLSVAAMGLWGSLVVTSDGAGWSPDALARLEALAAFIACLVALGLGLFARGREAGTDAETSSRLREQDRRYRALFDGNLDPMWVYDVETLRFVEANLAAQERYGYTREEFLRLTVLDLRPADDAAEVQEMIGRLDPTELRRRAEYRHRRKDGSLLWVEVRAHGLLFNSRPARIVVAHDVTEARAADLERASSERLYASLVEAIPDMLYRVDVDGRFVFANQAFCDTFQTSLDEVIGAAASDLQPADVAGCCRRVEEEVRATQQVVRRVIQTRDAVSDEPRWMEVTEAPVIDPGGAVSGIQSVLRDVTERVRSDAELQLAARVFETSPEGIAITDAAPRILRVNTAFERMTGFSQAELRGLNPRVLTSLAEDPTFDGKLWRDLTKHGRWTGEVKHRRKDGGSNPAHLSVSAVCDAGGAAIGFVALMSDLTERVQAEQRIEQLAHHDPLTGLPNRVLLQDRAAVAIAEARRDARPLALLLVDIDRFKVINDSLGHEIGDQLLREISRRIVNAVRAVDTVCRQGGDEFLILLPRVDHAEQIARVVERIIAEVERPIDAGGHELRVTLSAGVAMFPADGQDLVMLQRNADSAMYAAKDAGRGTYRFYSSEMNAQALEHLALEGDLRRAIQRDELFVEYQPLVSLDDGRVVGLEALVRWQHPSRGRMPPNRFIPIAEETGLIVQLGEWILRRACCERRRLLDAGLEAGRIAVNVSPIQFARPGFLRVVSDALTASGLPPALLELEVTEGVLMDNREETTRTLAALEELGVSTAIDDFGTGYSSLSYLRRLRVDILKIDRSFVDGLPGDADAVAIVSAVVEMARALRVTVVAEGVETAEQLEFLRGLGCEQAQGYYFARPTGREALDALLGGWRALVTPLRADQ